jgi:hypothetical protein
MMGIRPQVWLIAGLALVLLVVAVSWGRSSNRAPATTIAARGFAGGSADSSSRSARPSPPRARRDTPQAPLRGAAAPARERVPALAGQSDAAALRGGAGAGTTGPAVRQRSPQPPERRRTTGTGASAPRRGAAPPAPGSDARAVEKQAAQLAEELELPVDEQVEVLDPLEFESYDDLAAAAAANAVILEYRIELERAGGIPSDSVDARRAAITEEIANLTPSRRERWLRESTTGLAQLYPETQP